MKMIKISDDSHTQLKTQAAAKKMSMIEYVQYLLDLDKK